MTFYQSKVNEDAIAPTNDVYLGQTLIVTTELAYPLESVVQNLKVVILEELKQKQKCGLCFGS